MPESSEAKSYADIKIPLKEKPQLEVVKGETSEVPQKVQRKIAKKVAACISAGIVASTGGFIALGEIGNLPAQVQEWYDNTSENIRAIFGIEVVEEDISQTPEAPFEGLKIEGLDYVFQNGRWEYIDPDDGLVVGFWNDTEGRYEHTAEVLKGEWSGLFVNAVERNEEIKASLKENENWTVKRWEEGKIKMPIPFELSSETEIEERSAIGAVQAGRLPKVLLVSNLPSGTIVFTYFSEEGYNLSLGMPSPCTFDMTRDQLQISIWYKRLDQQIPNEEIESEEIPKKFGDPLLKVEESDVLSRKSLLAINPILKEKYQLVFTAVDMASSGLPIDFSFKNLLKDKEGRFIYLNSAYARFYSNNE